MESEPRSVHIIPPQGLPPSPKGENKLVVHTAEGIVSMEKEKWPKLGTSISSQRRGFDDGVQAGILGAQAEDDEPAEDVDEEAEEWTLCSKTGKTMMRRKYPAVATRKSSRMGAMSTSLTGGQPVPSMDPHANSFAVLNSIDDNDLNALALDCDIMLWGVGIVMKQPLP